jgi:hypothetical protein
VKSKLSVARGGGTIRLCRECAQRGQLAENLKKAQRDLKETVWRTYKNIMLLGKDNQIHTMDLGLVHGSSEPQVKFVRARAWLPRAA